MRRAWLKPTVVAVLLASVFAGSFALYQSADRPLVRQLVPIGVNIPPVDGPVVGWLDSDTVLLRGASFYSVDIATGRRNDLAAMNRRLNRLRRDEFATGSLNELEFALSPDGQWLLFDEAWNKRRGGVRVALAVDGRESVIWWPRVESGRGWSPSSAWLPDSSGYVDLLPGATPWGMRQYDLKHPGTFRTIPVRNGYEPELIPDVTKDRLFTLVRDARTLRILMYDRTRLQSPPVIASFPLRDGDFINWLDVDGRRGLLVYETEREREIFVVWERLRSWLSSVGISIPFLFGDESIVRDVYMANLNSGRHRRIGSYVAGDSGPGWAGRLPDGRQAFLYGERLLALPIPRDLR